MLAAYAISHGIVDCCCALLMLPLAGQHPLLFLIYNFCAFALQMPMGLLVERKGRPWAILGCTLIAVALNFTALPMAAAVLAGVGNAAFHIGGGEEILNTDDRMGSLGVFIAPGAVGLFFGRSYAGQLTTAVPMLLLLAAVVLLLCSRQRTRICGAAPQQVPRAGWFVLPLLAVVILRSLLGMSVPLPQMAGYVWLAPLASAVGKTLGGLLADRFGIRPVCIFSLLGAALLFCFAAQPVCGLLALLLFNMTMPITLGAVSRYLPGNRAFGFGLLTFGLFLGYLPAWLGLSLSLYAAAGICLLSLPLLLPAWREVRHAPLVAALADSDRAD